MRHAASIALGLFLLAAPAALPARADEGAPPAAQKPSGPVTLEVRGEPDALRKAAEGLSDQVGATSYVMEGEVLRITLPNAEAAEKARALFKDLGLKVRKQRTPEQAAEGKGEPAKEPKKKEPKQEQPKKPQPAEDERPVHQGRVFEAGPEQLEQAMARLKEAFPTVKARVQEGVLVLAARERKEFDGAVALLGGMGLRVAEPRGPVGPGAGGPPPMEGRRGFEVDLQDPQAWARRMEELERKLVAARQAGREREVAELEQALDRLRAARRAAQERGGPRPDERAREQRQDGSSELDGLRRRMREAQQALAEAEQRDARRKGESRLQHARQALEHLQAAGMDGLAQMVRAAIGRMERGLRMMGEGRERMAGRMGERMGERMRDRQGPPGGMGPQRGLQQGPPPQMPRRGPQGPGMGGPRRPGAQGPGPQGPPPEGAVWGRLPPGAPPSVSGVRRGQIFLPRPQLVGPDAPRQPQQAPQGRMGPGRQGPEGMAPRGMEQRGMQQRGMGPRGGMQHDGMPQGGMGPQRGPQGMRPQGRQQGPQQGMPQGGPDTIQALRQELEQLRAQLRYLMMDRLERPQGR